LNEIQTLTDLGLNSNQAKAYLALAKIGAATAKTISKISKVPRPEVYQIMVALQRIGLVEKLVTAPTKYNAISIEETIAILLQRRNAETSELETNAKKLLEEFQSSPKLAFGEPESQIILLPSGETQQLRMIETLKSADVRRICCIDSWKRFQRWCFLYAKDFIDEVRNKGIECRTITEGLENDKKLPKVLRSAINEKRVLKLRRISSSPSVIMVLFNGISVFIGTSTAGELGETPLLWSNNKCLLEMSEKYFEQIWSSASTINEQDTVFSG
jgi:sugar-specific transcriptional regulator TrmB